jgi:hypothetical protein
MHSRPPASFRKEFSLVYITYIMLELTRNDDSLGAEERMSLLLFPYRQDSSFLRLVVGKGSHNGLVGMMQQLGQFHSPYYSYSTITTFVVVSTIGILFGGTVAAKVAECRLQDPLFVVVLVVGEEGKDETIRLRAQVDVRRGNASGAKDINVRMFFGHKGSYHIALEIDQIGSRRSWYQ